MLRAEEVYYILFTTKGQNQPLTCQWQ